MRTLCTAVFLLLTTLSYCQKSTLLQNVNIRAKELKHHLNKTEDSLILVGERTIYKVEIFNKDFERTIIVKDSKVKIPLKDIPVGRFVVEAVLPDRLVVITLLRNESLNQPLNRPMPRRKISLFGDAPLAAAKPKITPKKKAVEPKIAEVVKKANVTIKKPTVAIKKAMVIDATVIDIKRKAIRKKSAVIDNASEDSNERIIQSYWIVYKTNNRHSSGRQMRFGDEAMVNKMISHINLDRRTIAGRDNELIVWEVYDVSAFLKYKMRHSEDFSKQAECFNAVPYFKTEKGPSEPEPKP
ncbi:hypothetical protein FBALC1_14332 [Flavobacteriales bacterium ALC-1]|nr:hypothetical protein FBALC1_14332 [Flavobacteriales bacterium ALC-1]